MDLSINKINKAKQQPSFQGMKGAISLDNTFSLKFIAPPYDHNNEKVVLEFVPLEKDESTDSFKSPNMNELYSADFNEDDTIELDEDIIDLDQDGMKELSDAFAYRFKIINTATGAERYVLDPFKTIDVQGTDQKMNIIDQGRKYGITPKAGTMYHAFIDSNVALDKSGNPKIISPDAVRNHFNKFGGSIKGLSWLLRNTDELKPYRYIMSTPDIGADPTSSHKYWPNNQFQCTNLEDFKEFNRELFKRGKGYVADGAFTSQSLQSPMLQHALKWGEESPFYTMMKMKGEIALGVLPNFSTAEGRKANEHIGVRIVNNPTGKDYDKNKPIYLQFFDDRLSSDKQRNSNSLIQSYDSNPKDHYDITSHQDSVQPFYFEIEPHDNRIQEFFKNGKKTVLLGDLFGKTDKSGKKSLADKLLTFDKYKITDKQHASGVTHWDGNVDIVKMNLSNPSNLKEREGMLNARNYLFNVASYWTETVQSDLILTTALMDDKEKAKVAQKNDLDFSKIDTKSLESVVLSQNKTVDDYIENFPLQSIETSPELSVIFSEPDFNSNLLQKGVKEKLKQITNEIIDSAIPSNLSDKDRQAYKTFLLKTSANTVIRGVLVDAISKSTNALPKDAPKALKEDGTINLDELKKVTLKSMLSYTPTSPKDEQKQICSRIQNSIINDEKMKAPKAALSAKLKETMKNVSLDDFRKAEAIVLQGKGGLNWRFDAAKDIGDLDAIRNGSATFDEIWNGTDLDPGVQAFWADFVSRIQEYNPSAYIINEITCLNELVDQEGGTSDNIKVYDMHDYRHMVSYDRKLAKSLMQKVVNRAKAKIVEAKDKETKDKIAAQVYILENKESLDEQKTKAMQELDKLGAFYNVWEEHLPYRIEMQFLERTNSTTDSNYGALFNKLSEFAGVNPEHINMDDNPGDIGKLKEQVDKFIRYAQPNTAMLSHVFIDNHDKPRVLHTMPLDMFLFFSDNPKEVLNKKGNEDLVNLVNNRTDYNNISTKALAVGRLFKNQIDKSSTLSAEQKTALEASLKNLVNGKADEKSTPSLKRANSFGVLPYEVTIRDMFKGAGLDVDKDETKEMILDFHSSIMKHPMELQERLWQVMSSLIGVNTLFNGTEFAQTGYETRNKNVNVTNRNAVLHNLKDDEKHGYKAYYDKMQAVSGLYKSGKGMSALKEGTPVSCNIQPLTNKAIRDHVLKSKPGFDYGKYNYFHEKTREYVKSKGKTVDEVLDHINSIKGDPQALRKFMWDEMGIHPGDDETNHGTYLKPEYMDAIRTYCLDTDENIYAWPLFKYDEFGSKTLSIITNNGMPKNNRSFEDASPVEKISVPSIKIDSENGCPLTNGTELYRKVYNESTKRYETEAKTYVIRNGALESKNGTNIELTDTVENFYVPSEEEKLRRAKVGTF